MPVLFPVLVVLGLALVVGVTVLGARQREQLEDLYRQVCLDHGLAATDTPLGTSDQWLAQFELLPRGDRDHSAVWGVQGPAEVTIGGTTVPVENEPTSLTLGCAPLRP